MPMLPRTWGNSPTRSSLSSESWSRESTAGISAPENVPRRIPSSLQPPQRRCAGLVQRRGVVQAGYIRVSKKNARVYRISITWSGSYRMAKCHQRVHECGVEDASRHESLRQWSCITARFRTQQSTPHTETVSSISESTMAEQEPSSTRHQWDIPTRHTRLRTRRDTSHLCSTKPVTNRCRPTLLSAAFRVNNQAKPSHPEKVATVHGHGKKTNATGWETTDFIDSFYGIQRTVTGATMASTT